MAELETFLARLTPETKARLLALSALDGRPAYALLEAAFVAYWKALPARKRAAAERLAGLSR